MPEVTSFVPPIRDDLAGQEPYGAPQLPAEARLNVNENPFDLPPVLVDALAEAIRAVAGGLNRYPDREAVELREAIASYLARESGVDVDWTQVWPANGSNEVMHHVFLAFGGPGRRAITFTPSYSMYPEYARDTFTEFEVYPRRADFSIDVDAATRTIHERRPSLVLLTSPNNPTGTALDEETTKVVAAAAMSVGAMLVVDEAYAEFRREGTPSALELLTTFPNLIVTRTMSKAFGLAGARVGYAVAAEPAVVDALRIVRLPYHLSAVTQAVAVTALAHADLLQQQVALLRRERDALAQWLRDQSFEVAASDANFLLFGRFADRDAVWRELLDAGVLIRQTGPEGWLRVSVGTPGENDKFRAALLQAPSAKGRLT